MKNVLLFSLCWMFAFGGAFAQNEHWSRQFKKPAHSTEMLATTGMSDGVGSPTIAEARWHDGKLWFSGSWETGVSGADPAVSQTNVYWNLWTWSPVDGYEAVVYHHTAQGGVGPMGVINDFLWLPDGRLVVVGEFTNVDNPGGTRYRQVQAMAVYDKNEPTANKWQPLGSFQYNGTVSGGGSIYNIEYDTQGNDLYIVGTFAGIAATPSPFQIHRYDFDTKSYEPLKAGIYGTNPKFVRALLIDESTTPSTIYIGGSFKWVGGDGNEQQAGGTALYTDAVASYQEGRDDGFGWKSYGRTLMKNATFMFNSQATVHDLELINGELWVVGAFRHETNTNVVGIAKWDATANDWVDPTGKGGVGRDVFSIAKADNGKVYFAGAFGGRNGTSTYYDGFANGDDAHMAMSYDPSNGTWEQLGNGLSSIVMPECRLTVHGNDVYYYGDFQYHDPAYTKTSPNPDFESYFVARWNETKDFSTAPIITGTKTATTLTINVDGGLPTDIWTYALNDGTPQAENLFTGLTVGKYKVTVTNGTYTEDIWAEYKAPPIPEVAIGGNDNIHWSRMFPNAVKNNAGVMDQTTGMKQTLSRSTAMEWYNDKLYLTGNIDIYNVGRWFVWCYDPVSGWSAVADNTIFTGAPEGLKWHNDKLYVWGSLGNEWKGIAVYDPTTETWSKLEGTYNGTAVYGTGTTDGSSGIINDVKWDSQGNMYMVGNWAFDNTIFPADAAAAVKITPSGEYELLGKYMLPYEQGKPKGIYTILLDETQTPMDIYIGGTFRYIQGGSNTVNEAYNVAKWDHNTSDWTQMGIDPDGKPGLRAYSFIGFEFNGGYPVIRDLAMDKNGVLYAGGSVAIFDNNPIIAQRDEHFGIVKFDKTANKWVGATNCGGVSRDIYQMSWIDDNTMLLSGSFNHTNDFKHLGNVAKFDITSGELSPLGGGLVREGMDQLFGATIVHAVKGDEYYFFGNFDHAGVNANSNLEAPNSSTYIAMWNGTKNQDPNANLVTEKEITVCTTSKYSSSSVSIKFEAEGADEGETVRWYKWSSPKFVEEATGSTWTKSISGRDGDEVVKYVSIENADGVVGGKFQVTVKFVYKDSYNAVTPVIVYDEAKNELTSTTSGYIYEWYKGDTKLLGETRTITADGAGDYTVKIKSGTCLSQASEAITITAPNTIPIANAGADQQVGANTLVALDGSASSDPDGNNISYQWTSPAEITLSGNNEEKPTFTSPQVANITTFSISLVVNDGTDNSVADEVIITVDPITGIQENSIDNVAIYPNPVSNNCSINFEMQTAGYCEISILNITGQELEKIMAKNISSGSHSTNWNVKNLEPGIYFVKFTRNENTNMYKIVVK